MPKDITLADISLAVGGGLGEKALEVLLDSWIGNAPTIGDGEHPVTIGDIGGTLTALAITVAGALSRHNSVALVGLGGMAVGIVNIGAKIASNSGIIPTPLAAQVPAPTVAGTMVNSPEAGMNRARPLLFV